MARGRSWLRRAWGKATGEVMEIEQRDGTTATFGAKLFWHRLFLDQIDAACGVVPEGEVADAVRGATPRERERLEALAASGNAGDFLRGSGGEDELGLLEIADDVPDLSEHPEEA